MKPEEFAHYVDSQLRQGIPKDSLIGNLRAGGWTEQQITDAFQAHDKRVRKELLPTHRHFYTISEVILWIVLFMVVLLTVLFYLGGE
jgi:hypothetical protein